MKHSETAELTAGQVRSNATAETSTALDFAALEINQPESPAGSTLTAAKEFANILTGNNRQPAECHSDNRAGALGWGKAGAGGHAASEPVGSSRRSWYNSGRSSSRGTPVICSTATTLSTGTRCH